VVFGRAFNSIRRGWFPGGSSFPAHGRVVVGQDIEVHAIRGADWLQRLAGPAGGLDCVFTDDTGQKKAPGVLEVADEVNGAITGADDAQVQSDHGSLFVTDGLEGGDLHTTGEHGFEVLHSKGPGEGLHIE
jgi:hypothetical protein